MPNAGAPAYEFDFYKFPHEVGWSHINLWVTQCSEPRCKQHGHMLLPSCSTFRWGDLYQSTAYLQIKFGPLGESGGGACPHRKKFQHNDCSIRVTDCLLEYFDLVLKTKKNH